MPSQVLRIMLTVALAAAATATLVAGDSLRPARDLSRRGNHLPAETAASPSGDGGSGAGDEDEDAPDANEATTTVAPTQVPPDPLSAAPSSSPSPAPTAAATDAPTTAEPTTAAPTTAAPTTPVPGAVGSGASNEAASEAASGAASEVSTGAASEASTGAPDAAASGSGSRVPGSAAAAKPDGPDGAAETTAAATTAATVEGLVERDALASVHAVGPELRDAFLFDSDVAGVDVVATVALAAFKTLLTEQTELTDGDIVDVSIVYGELSPDPPGCEDDKTCSSPLEAIATQFKETCPVRCSGGMTQEVTGIQVVYAAVTRSGTIDAAIAAYNAAVNDGDGLELVVAGKPFTLLAGEAAIATFFDLPATLSDADSNFYVEVAALMYGVVTVDEVQAADASRDGLLSPTEFKTLESRATGAAAAGVPAADAAQGGEESPPQPEASCDDTDAGGAIAGSLVGGIVLGVVAALAFVHFVLKGDLTGATAKCKKGQPADSEGGSMLTGGPVYNDRENVANPAFGRQNSLQLAKPSEAAAASSSPDPDPTDGFGGDGGEIGI